MASIKLKKGDEYWCIHPRLTRGGGDPLKCKVIAFTTAAGKQVGVEFAEEVGGHSCDGRGPEGKCLWVRVSDLATDDMVKKLKEDAAKLKQLTMDRDGEDVEELEVEV